MLKIGTKTKLTPEEAIKRAKEFFSKGGYGLQVTDETPTSMCFAGGGGRVEVVACAEDKGASVDIISEEWDYQAREFLGKIS